uniref:C2H2-type domain-containing protein n=1 Tax=Ornithorhynchus anatinus TaxID=9258 RepID=A0A6I8PK47_ORNAN
MHNVLLLQQNVKQLQHNLHLGLAPAEAELYQYYLAQNLGLTGLKLDGTADPPLLVSPFQLDAAALAPGLVAGDLPSELRLAGAQLVGEDLALLPGAAGDPALKIFQCAVCDRFSSDSLEALSVHVGSERALPEEEWRAVVGDLYQCRLCNYNTQLKANFQLHCKTDKHVQKYQLVAHIKEGGRSNEWRLKCLAVGNPVHLKCNACDHYANSVDKLHLHTANHRHEAALRLYKHLQKHEGTVSPDSCYYYCALCDYSTKGKLSLVQHVHSVRHHQTEGLRRLQLHQQGLPPEDEENLSEIFFVRDCPPETLGDRPQPGGAVPRAGRRPHGRRAGPGSVATDGRGPADPPPTSPLVLFQFYQCPYCNYNSRDPSRIQVHVLSQHSMQPVICCPLCQDVLSSKMHLQLHLTHLHSVAPDCVEKLLLSVRTPPATGAAVGSGGRDGRDVRGSGSTPDLASQSAPCGAGGRGRTCPRTFTSPVAREQEQRRRPPPGADRPGSGSRCGPRGLAFKTPQPPGQQRQQALRAAATCGLCPRSFRSPPALRRHLEAAHPELGEPELRQLCAALPGDLGWPDAAPDEPARDPEAAEEAAEGGGAEGGPPAEEPGAEPKRTLPFRKGPNVTVEKFLDPSRPYKCTVCKESFTQKNILLVHYNSVSHLHKLKRVLREASGSPGPADGPAGAADHKPYKCGVCGVAYSQASTLEIHLRSVLHQTKARAARLDGSPGLTTRSNSCPRSSTCPRGSSWSGSRTTRTRRPRTRASRTSPRRPARRPARPGRSPPGRRPRRPSRPRPPPSPSGPGPRRSPWRRPRPGPSPRRSPWRRPRRSRPIYLRRCSSTSATSVAWPCPACGSGRSTGTCTSWRPRTSSCTRPSSSGPSTCPTSSSTRATRCWPPRWPRRPRGRAPRPPAPRSGGRRSGTTRRGPGRAAGRTSTGTSGCGPPSPPSSWRSCTRSTCWTPTPPGRCWTTSPARWASRSAWCRSGSRTRGPASARASSAPWAPPRPTGAAPSAAPSSRPSRRSRATCARDTGARAGGRAPASRPARSRPRRTGPTPTASPAGSSSSTARRWRWPRWTWPARAGPRPPAPRGAA